MSGTETTDDDDGNGAVGSENGDDPYVQKRVYHLVPYSFYDFSDRFHGFNMYWENNV